jgi:hypothetical protein
VTVDVIQNTRYILRLEVIMMKMVVMMMIIFTL